MKARIVVAASSKHGMLRAFSAVCRALELGTPGKRILLVDLDRERCATKWMALRSRGRAHEAHPENSPSQGVVRDVVTGVDLLPAGGLVPHGEGPEERIASLAILLAPFRSEYDWIVLDYPASFGYVTTAALEVPLDK